VSVFWLIVLAAAVCLVTVLWLKEAVAVEVLNERLARRDRDIARLDELLLRIADERRATPRLVHQPAPAHRERVYRWVG
jgi:hypothetical protein